MLAQGGAGVHDLGMARKVEGGGRSGRARPRDGEEDGGWPPERAAPEEPDRAAPRAVRWAAAGAGGTGSGQIGRWPERAALGALV
jgi:hypothetical protein